VNIKLQLSTQTLLIEDVYVWCPTDTFNYVIY